MTARQSTNEQVLPQLRIINVKLDRFLSEVFNSGGRDDEERLGDGMLIE